VGAQQLGGESRLTYAQELSLTIFIFVVTMSAGFAGMSALIRIQRKLSYLLSSALEGLREDQRMLEAFYCVMYCVVSLALWISFLFAVFGLEQFLKVVIWD